MTLDEAVTYCRTMGMPPRIGSVELEAWKAERDKLRAAIDAALSTLDKHAPLGISEQARNALRKK